MISYRDTAIFFEDLKQNSLIHNLLKCSEKRKKVFVAFVSWPFCFHNFSGQGYVGSENEIVVFGFLIILGLMFPVFIGVQREFVIVSSTFVNDD